MPVVGQARFAVGVLAGEAQVLRQRAGDAMRFAERGEDAVPGDAARIGSISFLILPSRAGVDPEIAYRLVPTDLCLTQQLRSPVQLGCFF